MCVLIVGGAACSDDDAGDADKKDSSVDEGGKGGSGRGGSGGTGKAGTGGKAGGGGSGGTSGDAGVDAGGERCGVVTCDSAATCDKSGDEPKCVCPDGYEDPTGFGTRCLPPEGKCEEDDDCDGDDSCVDSVCCSVACDAPPACKVATCTDGETCVYADQPDGTTCDDGDMCTDSDQCSAGVCAGTALTCDDGNICTADSCDPTVEDADDRCVNDGTDITTAGCMPDTACASEFICQGNKRGDCVPNVATDCSTLSVGCNQGQCDPANGECVAVALADGESCNDNDACTTGDSCSAGQCTSGGALPCDDGNPCTDDRCDTGSGCVNTGDATNACDDGNPCTETDRCNADTQQCGGTPKVCPESPDTCQAGMCDPASGACGLTPKPNGTACPNDGKSCTAPATQQCSGGVCGSTSSFSACGEGAVSCTETGGNRTCACASGYAPAPDGDSCVRTLCMPSPCHANANCTAAQGATMATCTCKPGYTGNGTTSCILINECTPGRCGTIDGTPGGTPLGTCSQSGPLQHSCACNPGYTEVNGTCVCAMDGVWAMKINTPMSWNILGTTPGTFGAEAWAIREHAYDEATGQLTVASIQCGGTAPVLCASLIVPNDTYGTFSAAQMYGTLANPGVPKEVAPPFSLPAPRPGTAFASPQTASLSGIHLDDPMGAWPSSRTQIGTAASPGTVNGAFWTDDDRDGKVGVTSFVVPPGRNYVSIFNDANGDPYVPQTFQAFREASVECNGEQNAEYAYPPLFGTACGAANPCRVKANFGASRLKSSLSGTFAAGSCGRITGDVTLGPINEFRTGGCTVQQPGDTQADCQSSFQNVITASDEAADDSTYLPTLGTPKFFIVKVPDSLLAGGLSCAEVRAMDFGD